jgi:hypothetical protein
MIQPTRDYRRNEARYYTTRYLNSLEARKEILPNSAEKIAPMLDGAHGIHASLSRLGALFADPKKAHADHDPAMVARTRDILGGETSPSNGRPHDRTGDARKYLLHTTQRGSTELQAVFERFGVDEGNAKTLWGELAADFAGVPDAELPLRCWQALTSEQHGRYAPWPADPLNPSQIRTLEVLQAMAAHGVTRPSLNLVEVVRNWTDPRWVGGVLVSEDPFLEMNRGEVVSAALTRLEREAGIAPDADVSRFKGDFYREQIGQPTRPPKEVRQEQEAARFTSIASRF